MKIESFRIVENEKSKGSQSLQIYLEAETQKESALLIHVANRFPIAVSCYGKVGENTTWAWITIPLKNANYRADYFGNEKF